MLYLNSCDPFNVFNEYIDANLDTNITKDEKGYTLSLNASGYKKEDISIDLKDKYLTVKMNAKENSDKKYLIHEFGMPKASRRFYIAKPVNTVKAALNDGLLTIKLEFLEPKKEYIEIE